MLASLKQVASTINSDASVSYVEVEPYMEYCYSTAGGYEFSSVEDFTKHSTCHCTQKPRLVHDWQSFSCYWDFREQEISRC